jgi:hypothetical protein
MAHIVPAPPGTALLPVIINHTQSTCVSIARRRYSGRIVAQFLCRCRHLSAQLPRPTSRGSPWFRASRGRLVVVCRYRSAGQYLCLAAPLVETIPSDFMPCDMAPAGDGASTAVHLFYDTIPDGYVDRNEFAAGKGHAQAAARPAALGELWVVAVCLHG